MGCLIGKHKVADTFSGPHEFELNVPLLEFYEDWEDIKFWEAVNHDFDPKDPMVSLEDLSPDKNARRILCRRKKTSELWTTAPDNHPSDGKGVVTGTVTMIAKKGTTASAEDIEKAPMWQMVWHFYVTAEGDEKTKMQQTAKNVKLNGMLGCMGCIIQSQLRGMIKKEIPEQEKKIKVEAEKRHAAKAG